MYIRKFMVEMESKTNNSIEMVIVYGGWRYVIIDVELI